MKTKKIIFASVLVSSVFLQSKAQLKVVSSGAVITGAASSTFTTAPIKSHIYGNSLFASQNSGSLQSAPYIVGNNVYSGPGATTSPDYTWYNDVYTGIFHPAAWQIGFATPNSAGTAMAERMRISYDGHLLINSTSYTDGEFLRVDAGTATVPSIETNNGNTGNGYAHIFRVASNTIHCMAVFNGTSEKFYVTGDGHVFGSFAYQYSDKRLKQNISPLSKALDKVLKLKGVSYNMVNETSDGKKYIGLIAQEVESIIPEVVSTNEKGIKAVAYSNLVALLIEAIKEQNKTIEEQKKDIQELKNNVQNLVQQMNSCCQAASATTGGVTGSNTSNTIPNANSSTLSQNVPNPFSENTEIAYTITPNSQKGVLYIFDMQGTLLKTYDNLKPGNGKLLVNGGELKPGMYLYSLIVDGKEVNTKRMILTK